MEVTTMKIASFLILMLLLIPAVLGVDQDEGEDIELYGIELEHLLNIGSGILAILLCYLTFAAYTRTHHQRLKYVSVAFALFAFKGFLIAHELFFEEWSWVDPLASVLDFVILFIFFFGIIKQ